MLAATDRSATADHAVEWAAEMARRYEAALTIVQVLPADHPGDHVSVELRRTTYAVDACHDDRACGPDL